MGKRKGSNRGSGSSSSGNDSDAPASTPARKPHVRRTFVERLVAKSEDLYSVGAGIAKMIAGRGAPGDVEKVAQEFVGVLEQYRGRFFALRDSGWTLSEPSKAEIKEGDAVMIMKEFLPKYDYIVGLAEGTTKLVAARVTPKGAKGADVLVTNAVTGAPYGLIPKGHLRLVR